MTMLPLDINHLLYIIFYAFVYLFLFVLVWDTRWMQKIVVGRQTKLSIPYFLNLQSAIK